MCDPNVTSPLCTSGSDGNSVWFDNYADPSVSAGTLISSTDGATTWSAVGSGPTPVSGPGGLLLAGNDYLPTFINRGYSDPRGCYSDNSRAVSATITPVPPSSLADCKKGGWTFYGNFKNQGDSVGYVAIGGKNAPSGA
jgi:hypothetical protein